MSLAGINQVFQGTRASAARAVTPPVPDAIQRLQEAQLASAGDRGWTGLNFMQANSAADVKEYLAAERDAARILMSANVPMFLLRYSYGTHKSMEAWLHEQPKGGKLKLNVTTMPSWHAGAGGSSSAASAIIRGLQGQSGVPKLDVSAVESALKSSGTFGQLVEKELAPLDKAAAWFVKTYDAFVASDSPTAAEAQKLIGELMNDLGHEAMGEKFAKENVYNVVIRLPDGKTIKKRFDTEGNDPPKPGRRDHSNTATNSGDIEIDIAAYAGKDIVVQAWPDGSAGVGGYKEAREIVLHL